MYCPVAFPACRMRINKIDLPPHVRFNIERCVAYARRVNSAIKMPRLPAEIGAGMESWHHWLRRQCATHAEHALT